MIFSYTLRVFVLVFIITEKHDLADAKNLKVHAKSKHTSGNKKTYLQGSETQCLDDHLIPEPHIPVHIPVHVPVKHPDVDDLHVYIHDGKSRTGN